MAVEHVILRKPAVAARRFGATGSAAAEAASPLIVEIGDLSRAKAAALRRKKDIAGVARSIPMKLIAPVARHSSAGEAADSVVTWGVRAVGADTSPYDGDGVIVAILDSGIDRSHPAFQGVDIVAKNFTSTGDDDEDGHGTHCAATVFGRSIDGLRIGVAPGVRKALIGKVLAKNEGSSAQLSNAIQWAVEGGANVISMSLGFDFPRLVEELRAEGYPAELATSLALEDYRRNLLLFERQASFIAAIGAFQRPALLVAAAGNESRRDVDPDFEIAVSPPAVADGFISVGAVGPAGGKLVIAPFSNTGPRVCAPGIAVQSAKRGGGLTVMDGTSMATPHVAGVAALWIQKLAKEEMLTSKSVTDRLAGTATTAALREGFDPLTVGTGLVRAPQE
ncbi:MAG TPA: S8 family serine peptidase [Thermoanaerobaculia bacterium]